MSRRDLASLSRAALFAAILALLLGACADASHELPGGDDTPDEPDDADTAHTADTDPAPDQDVPGDAPDDAPGDAPGDVPVDDTASDTGASDTASDADLEPDVVVEPGPQPVEPPPPPENDARVHHITVSILTSSATNANTDSSARICLSATSCFGLDTPDVNDRELGQTEVYHFDGLDLDRAALDRMTLETPSTEPDNDRWTPACVEVRFDGEPVYCNDSLPVHIGTGGSTNEVRSWTDPQGLHQACTTCWGSTLTHGPLLGPSGTDSVRVTARTDATRLTGLRLGTTPDLSGAPVVAWAWPQPADDFTADLVASGLAAGTEYFYRVEVDGLADQPVRSVRTAPAADALVATKLTFGSCSRETAQPIFGPILAGAPDLFLFIGDNNYANTRHRDALRWHYRRFRNVPERAQLVASVPTLATWDDHDFLANNSNGTCLGRAEALAAFEEYWANPASGLPEAPGTYFKLRWGAAAEVFVLDCRMYRPDVADPGKRCEDDPNAPSLPLADGPLGPVQEAWLLDGLRASDAMFKLVACGSRFSPEGSLDSWQSFPQASARLAEVIETHPVGGVVFLAGDIHKSLFARVPTATYDVPELVSSPLALATPGTCSTTASLQRVCFDGTSSYVEIEIDPTLADPLLTARLKDESGRERATWAIPRSTLE